MRRSLTLLAAVALGSAAPAAGQGVVEGRLVSTAGASAGLGGLTVVLHRIAEDAQGPVDSVRSGPAGSFRFRVVPDTAAVYLVSVAHQGVNYFADPLPAASVSAGVVVELAVADTSAAQPISLLTRRLLVGVAEEGGPVAAIELVLIQNAGPATRVADSTGSVLVLPLPRGASDVHVVEGDFSPEAIEPAPGAVRLAAPVSPGVRQLVLQYALPDAGAIEWTLDAPVDTLEVLLESPTARVKGLPRADDEPGLALARYRGAGRAGTVVTIELGRAGGTPPWVVPLLVGLLVAAFALALPRLRGRGARASRAPAVVLADRIALLDRRLAAPGLAGDARARLEGERAALRAELQAALAPPGDQP